MPPIVAAARDILENTVGPSLGFSSYAKVDHGRLCFIPSGAIVAEAELVRILEIPARFPQNLISHGRVATVAGSRIYTPNMQHSTIV